MALLPCTATVAATGAVILNATLPNNALETETGIATGTGMDGGSMMTGAAIGGVTILRVTAVAVALGTAVAANDSTSRFTFTLRNQSSRADLKC